MPRPTRKDRSRIGAVGQHAGDERSQDEPQRADPQHQSRGRFPDAERFHQRRQQRAHQDDDDAVLHHAGAGQCDPQFSGFGGQISLLRV